MAIIERDIVLQGKTASGDTTIDLPITALKNIEDTADIKKDPSTKDYIPVIDSADNGQMKKTPFPNFSAMQTKVSSLENKIGTALVSGENLSGNNGDDLNTVIISGQYKYTSSPANCPGTQTYGILQVLNPKNGSYMGSSTYVVQVAFAGVNAAHFGTAPSAGMYARTTADGGATWSAWKNIDENYGVGKTIPQEANLDDYKIPGVYHVNSAGVAATIQNTPVTSSGYRLEVRRIIVSFDRTIQMLYTNTRVPRIFVRTQISDDFSIWNNWYEIQMNPVSADAANTVNMVDEPNAYE